MMTKHRLRRSLPAALALAALAATILYLFGPWAEDVNTNILSREEVSNSPQRFMDNALRGPDELLGSFFIIPVDGVDPETLIRNSPLVVVATVQAAEIVDRPVAIDASKIPWPTPPPGADPKSGNPTGIIHYGFYSTRYTLQVEEFVKSDISSRPSTLYILQGGAVVDGKEIAYESIPLYRMGERYLLFLFPNPARRPVGDFRAASGGYGTFLLKGGQPYRPFGRDDSWVPYTERDEAGLLQFLRDAPKGPPDPEVLQFQ